MYNTMYGANQVQQTQPGNPGSQSAMQKHGPGPIHIKIEDQTGVNAMSKVHQLRTAHGGIIEFATPKSSSRGFHLMMSHTWHDGQASTVRVHNRSAPQEHTVGVHSRGTP